MEFINDGIVKEKDLLIVKLPSGNSKIIKIEDKKHIELGKFGSFDKDKLIGKPYGQWYEIFGNGEIRPILNSKFEVLDETGANNQEIFDGKDSQKISQSEIEDLKKESKAGTILPQDIIKTIAENNASFEKKTEYSKAKYIKRKESKFLKLFMPMESTAHNICEHFFNKTPEKINYIRIDTLSQLLSISNVCSSSRVLAVDNTQGMIIGSLLSRMERGAILGIHDGNNHNYDIIRYFNFSEEKKALLHALSWEQTERQLGEFEEVLPENATENETKGRDRRLKSHTLLKNTLDVFRNEPFDSLVISCDYEPLSVLKKLIVYLGGSRTVSLLAAFEYMRMSQNFLSVTISESWLREYQVLPNRTHPLMNMTSSGGYLLSAIYVFTSSEELAKRSKNN
ncbi:hypothetical protein BB559_000774 [Furculomyces boomerangus]|uniref:tRNA (adenine(58)-N(1))-methyltransferase non-catalytic subunit TRM6 n=1 Tax=Furculomyces boomerangus TaxID=61424 RepID=A0A2T9Z443_9FUNG|nr:hypothetical protein BB559_000774 [Furculomyces boomerangus]